MTRFRVGDHVGGTSGASFGAYAEYLLVPADGAIVPRPAGLSDGQAVAAFDGAVTALPYLSVVARLQAGQSILINGTSGTLAHISELAEAGKFVPVIGATHQLSDAADSHRLVETGHKTGSAVILIGGGSLPDPS